MSFTQYKFSPAQIGDAAVATAKTLSAAHPELNAAQFAADTIAARLDVKPEAFLQYGPYWWAVKAALRELGHDFGDDDDAVVRAEYGGDLPTYGVLVAGEQFREFYGAMFLAGSSQFWLDAEAEESYSLFDADMEIRRLGGKFPLRVRADMRAVTVGEDGAEPVLDGLASGAPASPFAVKFEYEAQLWTANVYAADSTAARGLVNRMLDSGRIARAVEGSKQAGTSALDGVGGAAPLFIDRAARRVCEMGATPGPAPARAALH